MRKIMGKMRYEGFHHDGGRVLARSVSQKHKGRSGGEAEGGEGRLAGYGMP